MFDEISSAVVAYNRKWQDFTHGRANTKFFEDLLPVAVGWKVADKAAYTSACAELHDKCDRIIETWMNGRWVAKLQLRDETLPGGIILIKIMQRRPNSDDALGLDHVDFYSDNKNIQAVLENEPGVQWTTESNDIIANYEWLSVWFDDTEAKIKSETVLDIIIAELQEANHHILGK